MEIIDIKLIDVNAFDKLVSETYKRPYSFQQQDGCKDRGITKITVPCEEEDYVNETIPEIVNDEEMGVSFKSWLERDPKQKLTNPDDQEQYCLDLWWERNFYPHVSMIVNDLYKKKLLNIGDYLIDINW